VLKVHDLIFPSLISNKTTHDYPAIAGLRIPTVRSLSLIHFPNLRAKRQNHFSSASVLCRVAPSFLRIGNYEIMRKRSDWKCLRGLVDLGADLSAFEEESLNTRGEKVGKAEWLMREAAKRSARMVAGWQTYGFIHGVSDCRSKSRKRLS
jgi:serine/tyrosine/threonine adenylyltransferase